MQPDEQWEFKVIVYPSDSKIFAPFSACLMPTGANPLASAMEQLTGHGDTPALAIADLFYQADRLKIE